MEIKTTRIYNHTPIRMAEINRETTSNVGESTINQNSHALLLGLQNSAVALENNLITSYKVKHTPTTIPNTPIPRCLPKKNESLYPYKNL